jgi:hypothetical protein
MNNLIFHEYHTGVSLHDTVRLLCSTVISSSVTLSNIKADVEDSNPLEFITVSFGHSFLHSEGMTIDICYWWNSVKDFDVLLTVHISIILAIDQLVVYCLLGSSPASEFYKPTF